MRPIRIGLAAALMLALTATAGIALAAKKADGGIDQKARTQGMAEAPAIAKSIGVACQITDARFIGKAPDAKTKTNSSFYEVDCDKGVGFVIQAPASGQAMAFTCFEANAPSADGKPSALTCKLPGNANPEAELAPLMTASGVSCAPEKARSIGQSPTQTYLEVLCPGNVGYVVAASTPLDISKPAKVVNCLNYDSGEGNISCKLIDKAARLAVMDRYAADAKNGCQIKDRRFIGSSTEGDDFFEASCQDGKGYIYKVSNKGVLITTFECAKAQGVLGGCTLTDAREAATEQAALYTRLAKSAGYPCEVSKYAVFPSQASDKDVVELVCADGTGGVGIFPTAGKAVVYDCGHALVAGYRCGLNKQESGYASLTADLRKFDQKTCTVSAMRAAAKTAKGTILMEVGCSDGLKGYMIEYSTDPVTAVGATGCAFAGGCKLPGNT